MKLKSFGCSFIYGSDLADGGTDSWATASTHTWPALIAKDSNLDYESYAYPGVGNLCIADQVLKQLSSKEKDLFIISWSWIDRFDYTITQTDGKPIREERLAAGPEQWLTLLPGDQSNQANNYYRHLHSEYKDKLSNLIVIKSVIDALNQHQIPFIMTYMDNLLFETEWNTSASIVELQRFVKPWMTTFVGQTFLDWSQKNNFPISPSLHPLEEAHSAAAKLILDNISLTVRDNLTYRTSLTC